MLPPNILIDQEPNQVTGFFADETCELCPTGQQTVAENFFQTANAFNIDFITIWGGYYPEDIPNTVDSFTIIIHSDAGGQPGEVLWSRAGLQPDFRTQTGVILYGTHEYMFDFLIDNFWFPPGTGTYWIELFNNSTESGNFYWETGILDGTNGIAGSASYTTTPGTSWVMDPYTDMGILITDNWIPVELVSFQAATRGSEVNLSWVTATETNNKGFEVHRKAYNNNEWETIGFVPGHGTTTETQQYILTDKDVMVWTYQYRLKQIDYDGTYKYSKIVSVDIPFVNQFSLSQNFPNPFNPSTTIKYSVPSPEKVIITVYGILGNEISVLVDEEKPAGSYEVNFDASDLVSGVYFYTIKASPPGGQAGDPSTSSGQVFVQMKKMILIK